MMKKTVELMTEKGKRIYVISFLDEMQNPCEESVAKMVSISEYDENNTFIKNTLGNVL